jgi:hypothetical protein
MNENIVFGQPVRNAARAILRKVPGYTSWRKARGYGHNLLKAQIIDGAQALGVWDEIEKMIQTRGETAMPEILNEDDLGFVVEQASSGPPPLGPGPKPPLPDLILLTEVAQMAGLDKTTVSATMKKFGCKPMTIHSPDGQRHHAFLRADVERLLALPRRPRGGFILPGEANGATPASAHVKPAPPPARNPALPGAIAEMTAAMGLLTETFAVVARLIAEERGDVDVDHS